MKAIIPVAGVGTRLRPLTLSKPKVLLNVAGKPIIAHILDHVAGTRIDHIVFIVGYMKEEFEQWAKDRYPDLRLEFVEQTEILGLGHAVGMGLSEDDGEVMVILGDTIFELNLDEVLQSKYSSLGVQEVEDARRFGVVMLEDDFITDLVEKSPEPPSNLAIVGLYFIKNGGLLKSCIDGIISDNVTVKGEYQITDALKRMVDSGEKMTTFSIQGWHDCGTADTLLDSNKYLLKISEADASGLEEYRPGNVIHPPVFIDDDVRISNSVIGPYVSIGRGAEIEGSIVEDSIIEEKAHISSALLKRSIIGKEAAITGQYQQLNLSDYSSVVIPEKGD
ncbi:nucleotidyl transferase [candidate division LCP-89 bacterium B3_LCP]|uniref:Nucleotidyl transferase n=1 Tax=candidate division LCP-89 bacterium B3_LCP TaxID=2012998 RepID=A0A532V0W5_UNCL8|nr:MAG: nucleotidyl transferase [candidate division LCP-89 bacterium B3_LCP]